MYDQSAIANNVSRWTGLGVKLPKELAAAIELYETLRYTEVGHQPVFDLGEITAENAEDKIRQFADQLAVSETPAGGQSVLQRAKKHAMNLAAHRVVAAGRAAVPEIIKLLTPEFNLHAKAYTDAVRKFPADPEVQDGRRSITTLNDRLVAAGPDAVAAYGDALREAQYLNNISSWVAGTAPLFVSDKMEVTLRILRPSTHIALRRLDSAEHRSSDPAIRSINPAFYTAAVRSDVEFGINTLAEAAEIRASIERAAAMSLQQTPWK